jgi:uncharacterized protein
MSIKPAADKTFANHLIHEKSPYLAQHVHNPVDWYPWGDEAFRRAMEENKPVFLSIGYATCHWCHVMAHESFEDREIASLLNFHFIAIKVDREERPDIDSVYMMACQQMTGHGGWPLTIIMTPDKKPFFAGTYLPRTARAGMSGLSELLTKVIVLWQDQRDTLTTAADQLTATLANTRYPSPKKTADQLLLQRGFDELAASFDPVNGGFGRMPKFPTPVTLLFLLRFWKRTGSGKALRMVEETLEAIRCGGIHDHIGGGFHRYSTDAAWKVPHFEKMLYDQALLLMVFTEAWQVTRKPVYRETAEAIIAYVTRDLMSPEGAFFSAEDADSPGGEGAFYLWTKKELDAVLGSPDSNSAVQLFGVIPAGNFPAMEPGKNILFLQKGLIADPVEQIRNDTIRKRLLAEREKRPRPLRDEKILADWNGLMVAALAQASRTFGNSGYYSTAEKAMRFVLEHLRLHDGGLLHRYCDGEAAIVGFSDDYSFVIRALIELYETSFDTAWLEEALLLHRYVNRHFSDKSGSGYFTTSDEGEALIVRKKEIYDGAIPSCNSVMLENLVLLGHLTGDFGHEELASRLADSFSGIVSTSPSSYSAYLCALDHLLGPATDIVIIGEESDPGTQEMIRLIRDTYLPSVTLHVRNSNRDETNLDTLAPFTRMMKTRNGQGIAYVCTGHTCSAAVTTPESLRELLGEKR